MVRNPALINRLDSAGVTSIANPTTIAKLVLTAIQLWTRFTGRRQTEGISAAGVAIYPCRDWPKTRKMDRDRRLRAISDSLMLRSLQHQSSTSRLLERIVPSQFFTFRSINCLSGLEFTVA